MSDEGDYEAGEEEEDEDGIEEEEGEGDGEEEAGQTREGNKLFVSVFIQVSLSNLHLKI